MAPAGQLWSTVADLARWARFLADGRPDVLARGSLREMGTPHPAARITGCGLQVVAQGERTLVGHGGTMPGFRAGVFVDPERRDGVVALCNATTRTGLRGAAGAVPRPLGRSGGASLGAHAAGPGRGAADARGLVLGQHGAGAALADERLELREVNSATVSDAFELRGDLIVGVSGYHRGEVLHVRPSHLECATFVYTRTAYDPPRPFRAGRRASRAGRSRAW